MIIKLKDGSVKEYSAPVTAAEITKDISMGLYRNACCVSINGKIADLRTVVEGDCDFEVLTFDDEDGKKAFNHTASHVMAQAVKRLYPNAKLTIGPAIENGFYYDFDVDTHFTQDDLDKIEKEMKVIADSGMEEILILTGESRGQSSVEYIGEACKLARKYFRMVGLEIYPVNTDEYRYLHECGADYVTVFQETYDTDKYETLHLMGHKRVWPYRFDAQERALRGGMRGVAFSALLGLSDFRKDALASALHVYYLQRKYPHAEMSLSCPRLRPIINNDKINPLDVHEKQLCQIICAYRIFLPFVGITVSSRESASFRDGIVKIAATKVSAGVSTGIGDHDSKYNGKENEEPQGDEQFEINDSRSLDKMYQDIAEEGLQPVLNDYLYIG